MPLEKGSLAPNFTLLSDKGGSVSLEELKGYVLLTFYKSTCPTCQLTLPFISRLKEFYPEGAEVLGVIQDPRDTALSFARDYGLTITQLIDAPDYEVSVKYDVRVVPTIYLISPDREIVFVEEGFVKSSMEELNSTLARISNREINPLFEDVSVPAFKAG